jgi:hypothetical protein
VRRGCGIVQRKITHNQCAVEPTLIHRSSETDLVNIRLGGRQKACPSRREFFHAGRRRKRGRIRME